MATNGTPAPSNATIAVRLTTRSGRYSIPDSKYVVPADWRRYQLSELINKVLENVKPVPFDFLVDGELLKTSIAAYIKAKGLSEESVLELEYIESVLPPEYVSAFEHDDWVSDVSLARSGTFLTGCYNATVSLFSTTGQRQATITGHSQPVLSTCWLGDSEDLIASGGMDRIIRVNRLSSPAALDATTIEEPQRTAALTYLLPLHSQPVSSVRSSSLPSTAPRLLSAGWDGLVALWSLSSAYEGATAGEEEVRAKKKRKTAARPDETGAKKLAAVHVLQGHTGQVARAVFDREEVRKAYSAGWDHSVRTWDLEAGSQLSTRSAADKVLLDLDQMASANLLVTGSTDRTVCFWDTRQDSSTISLTLAGHTAPVSTVRAHPTSPVLALSASYDGLLRIWDARSPKQALFAVRRRPAKAGSGEKVLCADWDPNGLIAAGGEDGRVELHRAGRMSSEV